MKTTNWLIYKTEKNWLNVTIRLNDERKNWHNDFSVTANLYENWRLVSLGCLHDEILKLFPEFKIFIDLHLCDEYGLPIYTVSNMIYHIKNNKEKVLEYYNSINKKDLEILEKYIDDNNAFEYMLWKLGIIKKRNNYAKEAIKQLEELTGEKYEYKNKASTYLKNSFDTIEIEKKIKSWFFNKDKVTKRQQEKVNNKIKESIEYKKQRMEKEIKNVKIELKLFEIVANKYFELTKNKTIFDNFICYHHDNRIVFNWKWYGDEISQSNFELIRKEIKKDVTLAGYEISMK